MNNCLAQCFTPMSGTSTVFRNDSAKKRLPIDLRIQGSVFYHFGMTDLIRNSAAHFGDTCIYRTSTVVLFLVKTAIVSEDGSA